MVTLYEPPVSHVLTALLVLAGACAAVAGVGMMSRALRRGDAIHLIRGIRVLILGLVAGLAALTFATGNTGFLVIGLLILAEEIYETATLAAIIRLGDCPAARSSEMTGPAGIW
jgi:hypothetical protein